MRNRDNWRGQHDCCPFSFCPNMIQYGKTKEEPYMKTKEEILYMMNNAIVMLCNENLGCNMRAYYMARINAFCDVLDEDAPKEALLLVKEHDKEGNIFS